MVPFIAGVVDWFVRILSAAVIAAAAVPFVPTGCWFVRVFDFPRLQFGVAGIALIGLVLVALPQPEASAWAVGLVLASIWQLTHVATFTPLVRTEVPASTAAHTRMVTANLDIRNQKRAETSETLCALDADILLLVETDDAWMGPLDDLRRTYPHRIEHIAPEGLGMVLWSRLELSEGEGRFLVSDARVSIAANLHFQTGSLLRVRGVHPTPPALSKEHGESERTSNPDGRHDSRIRDAELVLIAKEVAEDGDTPWVVTGDFNDVAWSRTTRLFKRLSGLRDPRIGRSLLNTYHARYPLLRYPLDHVMVSPGIGVERLERVAIPGSDHFGIVVDFEVGGPNASQPHPASTRPVDGEEPAAILREGRSDASN